MIDDQFKTPAKKPFVKYGIQFPEGTNLLTAELYAFREGLTPEEGGLGKFQHFKNVSEILWGPKSSKHFIWHPWAEDMIKLACEYDYLAVAGCANSGKSEAFALWAIINYICAPLSTTVLVTSTTLSEARKRIWGSLHDLWQACPGLPGKIIDSLGFIRFEDEQNPGSKSTRCGIFLVAAEKKKEKDAIGKLIGIKNDRVFLIADELPEISEAVLEAGRSNLSANPKFQLIGLGNPASYYDAFGVFAKPKNGYGSINSDDEEWETEDGYCIRFDALKSPNVVANETKYKFLPTIEKIDAKRKELGENSLSFWRMWRGYWCPSGAEEAIYSEADFLKNKAEEKVKWGDESPIPVAALDPAFTTGGDRSILYFGRVGFDSSGNKVLMLDDYVHLQEDITAKNEPLHYQIARQFMEQCKERGVAPRNAAFDASGAGLAFASIVEAMWSDEVYQVHFGGAASDMPCSISDDTPSHKKYVNRVSELWFAGKELMTHGQLKGVCRDAVVEMTARKYSTSKSGDYLKLQAEPKSDMKSRIGKSPDIADALFILLDLVRNRHGMSRSGGYLAGQSARRSRQMREWTRLAESMSPMSMDDNLWVET